MKNKIYKTRSEKTTGSGVTQCVGHISCIIKLFSRECIDLWWLGGL